MACLFICGVMFYLMKSGVSLKERRMVKWSSVPTASHAGDKISQFMFPILNEYEGLYIQGDGPFVDEFVASFRQRSSMNKVKAEIVRIENPQHFKFLIVEINPEVFKENCKRGENTFCIGLKSYSKFQKKERDPNKIWISAYRLRKDQAVMFYKMP